MNQPERIEGPTSSVGERVCAARKQAADARTMIEQLLATCGTLRARLGSELSSDLLLATEEELHAAIVHLGRADRGLGRVQW